MSALRTFIESYIQNAEIVDIILGVLTIVLAGKLCGALGLDILNR